MRLIALVLAAVAAGSLAYAFSNVRKGYEPRQPIAFSHRRMAGPPVMQVNAQGQEVNVGGFGIACVYCHTMPYKGRHSTLPSTAVCMNCHSNVGLDKEWVLKMKDYWDRGEPIPWVKVHDLADFVYFDHSAHLNAKDASGHPKLPVTDEAGQPMPACQTCHGKVQEMEIVSVQQNFNMQWCLDCHRKPEMQAPTDCITCHR
ncbi:MAG: cytochrome c3 family protein [Acidobacteria bacterium]|nr:cytochrome c3 family protein [Acidobacteriota bacterium]